MANGLLRDRDPVVWERAGETLLARKTDIEGLAVATDEQVEACILYIKGEFETEIVTFRSFVEDGRAHLAYLLSRLGNRTVWFRKVHAAEVSTELLESLGFGAAGKHVVYATRARSA